MKLNDIWVSQIGLRNKNELKQMIEYVKNGHIYTLSAINAHILLSTNKRTLDGLVELVEFEDGRIMIHNGHHRCVSILLGRKTKELYSSEYVLKKYKYSEYMECNLPIWSTPFDPRTHVRVPNLKNWKSFIEHYYNLNGPHRTELYIYSNKNKFSLERNGCFYLKDIIN